MTWNTPPTSWGAWECTHAVKVPLIHQSAILFRAALHSEPSCCFSCFQMAWNQDTIGFSGCSVALSCPCFWVQIRQTPSFMRVELTLFCKTWGRRRFNSVDSWTRCSCRRANIWGLWPEILESVPHHCSRYGNRPFSYRRKVDMNFIIHRFPSSFVPDSYSFEGEAEWSHSDHWTQRSWVLSDVSW